MIENLSKVLDSKNTYNSLVLLSSSRRKEELRSKRYTAVRETKNGIRIQEVDWKVIFD